MQDTTALEELTTLVQAAIDPYFEDSDPTEYAALFAENATYFDPNSSGKLEGEAIRQLFATYTGQIPPDRYEVLNPAVSLQGDTAVFTFNLDTFDKKDGSVTSRWNTTQVHMPSGDGWDMIHAHWSHRDSAS